MKHNISNILLTLVLLAGFSSCEQDDRLTAPTSGIRVLLQEALATNVSRSTPAEIGTPLADKFNIKVTNKKTFNVVHNDVLPENGFITTGEGNYDIVASFGSNAVLAFDAPYYEGTATANVKSGEATSVAVDCKVANSLLSIAFKNEAKFKEYYSHYEVRVAVGNKSLSLSPDNIGQSAYFRANANVKLFFVATVKDSGNKIEYALSDDNLQSFPAGYHKKVTIEAAPKPNALNIANISKVEEEKVTIASTIPMEWMPAPTITGAESIEHVETDDFATDAVIGFSAFTTIEEVQVFMNGEPLTTEQLAEKNITINGLNTLEGSVDFSEYIAALRTNNGATVSNNFDIKVKSGVREATHSLAINVVKPEFTISISEQNVWTKEFTIDVDVTKGDAEALKKKLSYEFATSENANAWTACDSHVQFESIPAEKNYWARASVRGFNILSNTATATLETPVQLPNSDMEDWWIEKKTKSNKTYYTFHPYAQNNGASSWWDTNNNKAQGGTIAFGIWYEGCFASCVSYTEDAHQGGKAALLYLSGCGSGYANTAGTYVGGAMVGSLFIGSYNNDIKLGHDFAVRPTQMSFWYKYKPYNEDAFKAEVILMNGTEIIASGVFEPAASAEEDSEYKKATVDLQYHNSAKKATSISVQFLASNKTSLSRNDFEMGTTIVYPTLRQWQVHMGSVLKIDDISLVYGK